VIHPEKVSFVVMNLLCMGVFWDLFILFVLSLSQNPGWQAEYREWHKGIKKYHPTPKQIPQRTGSNHLALSVGSKPPRISTWVQNGFLVESGIFLGESHS